MTECTTASTQWLERNRETARAALHPAQHRRRYEELIAQCLSAYHRVHPLPGLQVAELCDTLHAFARVTASAAVLCAGDVTAYRALAPDLFSDRSAFADLFATLMDRACAALPDRYGKDPLNFAVRDLMLAYRIAQDCLPPERLTPWRDALSDPALRDGYTSGPKTDNRNVYIMGAEQLRHCCGLTDAADFISRCWERQRTHFSDDGMYLDNYDTTPRYNPVLYDLTTRVQLQFVLWGGYEGAGLSQMRSVLQKGGLWTLFSQSATGQLPSGGRSNQYLFNEALICANCEFEAAHYHASGNRELAGAFRRAAELAMDAIPYWLGMGKHLRNCYADAGIGTEGYGYYDKYMVTLSSMLAAAWLFTDDRVPVSIAPAETGGYAVSETQHFHLAIANAGGYSIEVHPDADPHYDAPGLARIQHAGMIHALLPVCSFPADPSYRRDPRGLPAPCAMGPGFIGRDGTPFFLAERYGLHARVLCTHSSPDKTAVTVQYRDAHPESGAVLLEEQYTLTPDGVTVTVTAPHTRPGSLYYALPVLESDGDLPGAAHPTVTQAPGAVTVRCAESLCRVCWNGDTPPEMKGLYANRNGLYRLLLLHTKDPSLSVHFTMQ